MILARFRLSLGVRRRDEFFLASYVVSLLLSLHAGFVERAEIARGMMLVFLRHLHFPWHAAFPLESDRGKRLMLLRAKRILSTLTQRRTSHISEFADPMDSTAIRGQIDRILNSQSFASKNQLRRLLEVLFDHFDSQTTLKPDRVIKELWPTETRTKRSADLATEMNRLRHALAAYYDAEGKNDPVIIILPSRSVAAGRGRADKRWIAAVPRGNAEELTPEERASADLPRLPQVGSRRGLKIAGLVAALCAVPGIVAYIFIQAQTVHGQPRFARLDGSLLVVMNAEGKELWSRKFPEGFGPESYYAQGLASRLWFADLEGKGHMSVLFSYAPAANSQPHSSTLICYSDRGKEKWRWTPGRDLPEVSRDATYKTLSLGVLKATGKRPPRIVVVSNCDPWWGGPSQIALLDTHGKTLSEYWHSGGLHDLVVADLDGDGKEQIIATGVARGYDAQATMVVLDSDRVFGASKEVQPEYQVHGMQDAQERLRLLFPQSDLNRASFQFSFGDHPTYQNGNLQLNVMECLAPIGCPVRYEFNKKFELIAAYSGGNEFKNAHDRFYQNGKDAHTLGPKEQAAFLKVRCLVGCNSEFVPLAQTFSPAASFEDGWISQSNPNGVWSYGYSAGFTDPITLYDKTARNGINGPNAQYWISSSVNKGTSPSAEYNNGPPNNDGNIDFLANEFLLVAGIRGQYSNLIFTAPTEGVYSIFGKFRGAQYAIGTVVAVVANKKVIFSSRITSVDQLAPFDFTLNLRTGNTVVFSVGPGGGSQNTGLSLTITKPCALTDRPVPVPTGEITCSSRPTGE